MKKVGGGDPHVLLLHPSIYPLGFLGIVEARDRTASPSGLLIRKSREPDRAIAKGE